MKLVQKLPLGLSVACLLFASSCSKEEIQVPEPQTANVNEHSNLKLDPGGSLQIKLPYLASTYGPTGFDTYPAGWGRSTIASSNNLLGFPTATSSLTALFGNPAYPWVKPLPPIPTAPNANSILTFTSHEGIIGTGFSHYFSPESAKKRSAVVTKIKNLKPGKKYSFDVYAATTICKVAQNGYSQRYATAIAVTHTGSMAVDEIALNKGALNQAVWVLKNISFVATDTEMNFYFSAVTDTQDQFTYGHIFIDEKSLK